MRASRFIYILIVLLCTGSVFAQDAHHSQYFNLPAYYNPAAAGHDVEHIRLTGMYRKQWPALSTPFVTQSILFDKQVSKVGFGAVINNNTAGDGGIRRMQLGGMVSYRLQFGDHQFASGLNIGFIQKSFDPSKMTFDDQYRDDAGYDPANPTAEQFAFTKVVRPDFSAGILYSYGDIQKTRWVPYLGASLLHINQPDEVLIEESNTNYIKTVLQAGTRFSVNDKVEIDPSVMMAMQQFSNEMMFGTKAVYSFDARTKAECGVYVRNKESVIAYAGYQWNSLKVGVSYDANISGAVAGPGAFEISLTYIPKAKIKKDKNAAAEKTEAPKKKTEAKPAAKSPSKTTEEKKTVEKKSETKPATKSPSEKTTPSKTTEEKKTVDKKTETKPVAKTSSEKTTPAKPAEEKKVVEKRTETKPVTSTTPAKPVEDKKPAEKKTEAKPVVKTEPAKPKQEEVKTTPAKETSAPVKTEAPVVKTETIIADTDKDGVNDKEDKCPTEPGTASTNGCPDTDKDGISDKEDHCPLEKGIAINNGCPEKISVDGKADRYLHFKPNSSVVDRFEVIDILEPVSDKLFFDSNLKLVITGHAFEEGNSEQSKALSKARAEAVKQYFIEMQNVPAEKIETVYYGDTKPMADGTTDTGKKQNRCAEIYIIRK